MSTPHSLKSIPPEMIENIYKFLPQSDVLSANLLCKNIDDNDTLIRKTLFSITTTCPIPKPKWYYTDRYIDFKVSDPTKRGQLKELVRHLRKKKKERVYLVIITNVIDCPLLKRKEVTYSVKIFNC